MISEHDWLKLRLQEGKVILIKSDFIISVEKILRLWERLEDSQEQIMILSVFSNSLHGRFCIYRQISREEEERIFSLYLTYEFANNFRVLSRQTCCGSFLNLVDAGMISLDEALVAWMHG